MEELKEENKTTKKKGNLILDLSFAFALEIIKFSEELEARKKYSIAKQIIRCGTSIGANIREAQGAESKSDFIHKLKIAYKESEETEYFLLLCEHSNSYPTSNHLIEKVIQIKKLLTKIIASTRNNLKSS
jgi:four helix bundle protein